MSVQKMQFVTLSGDNALLHETAKKLYRCGYFQPESAGKHISVSLGFLPYADDNPYAPMLEKIHSRVNDSEHTVTYNPEIAAEPLTGEETEKLNDLYEKAAFLSEKKQALISQKNACEEGITKFSHFKELEVNLDDIIALKYVTVRFGHMPRESAKKIPELFDKCPYI